MKTNERRGTIVAVCTSDKPGIPKEQRSYGIIAPFGLLGDYHCRPMRESFSKRGTMKPNTDRHITIVAQEVLDDVRVDLGISLVPGSLAENITVRGLGNLSDIAEGVMIRIGKHVYLRVTKQNNPCEKLLPLHRLLVKNLYKRRGLLCAVEDGVGRTIRPGDPIYVS